jgi:DNA-binding LytR/AlgR family response regulator
MKILIVEDEPQTAQLLNEIIVQVKPNANVLGITESIHKTLAFLANTADYPDLIFMDIQLADGNSFEIFAHSKVRCPVVFCTAYDQFALQAFKANGIAYLLKPVTEDDVRAAFAKLEALKQMIRPEDELVSILQQVVAAKKKFKTSILVHYRDNFIPLLIANIAAFVLENELIYVYTFDASKYPVSKSLDELEQDVDPADFYRINRQTIINRRTITQIQPYFNRKVIIKPSVKLSEQLIVSRLKVSEFLKWVEQPE